jgi:trimethylamine--corrinoid protein Co-methyltransferase
MPHLKVLSDDEVREIHEASLDILSECGVQLLNADMLRFLESRGLPVDHERQCVRMSRACIEDALTTVPHRFDVYDREGVPAFSLGDGEPRIAAGHNAVFWVDSETGKTRPSTVADVERFARICEALPHIDMIGIPVMPQDVAKPETTLLYGVKACVENSKKPIFFSTDSCRINKTIIEMLAAVFPGDMRERPYGISQLSPTSPLFWEGSVLEALRDTVEAGVPLAILPEPIAGISSPYTLAGLLTMNNAECLSGIVLTQLIRPGARVLYANSWTTSDMRSGAALVGSCETSICRIAGAQLGKFYGVPTHTTAPNSDNHAHDEQNAWEKTLSTFCAVGAGNDLIVNCGMFATGLTCSHEQLVMDEEISAMSRRIAAGVRVEKETIAKDLIVRYGPHAAEYLSSEHTLEWLHSDEYFMPRVAVRGPRSTWEAQGAPDTYALAKKAANELASTDNAALDDQRRGALEGVVKSF